VQVGHGQAGAEGWQVYWQASVPLVMHKCENLTRSVVVYLSTILLCSIVLEIELSILGKILAVLKLISYSN
jgi:hypothetical protein